MIPDGYELRRGRRGEGWALFSAGAWLQGILDSDSTVYGWAAARAEVEELRGRGTVYAVRAPAQGPEARRRWAVRHYRRGGAIRRVLGDRYLRCGPTRPERETRVVVEARSRGVPTPAVVAAVWYPKGPFYRADLVTELLPDAVRLADIVFSGTRDATATEALAATGRLIERSASLGVHHADVNAMNVVFCGEAQYDGTEPGRFGC